MDMIAETMDMVAGAPFVVSDMAPLIGSAIRTDKDTLLSGRKAKEIREILERRGVIVFPQIGLSD